MEKLRLIIPSVMLFITGPFSAAVFRRIVLRLFEIQNHINRADISDTIAAPKTEAAPMEL